MDRTTVRTFLSFDNMIAPSIIKLAYFIGLALITISALFTFFGSFAMMKYSFAAGLSQMFLSIIGFAVGVLFWRIIMEIYMVFFSINDRLKEIRDRLTPGTPAAPDTPLSDKP